MENSQPNRTSNAATRKRRSSILKSQRPPRTPFSEIELSVATPTDTVKSRRVSFSRRTGVAEFVTNEATTTWKNFYEEHNKSLESSVNEPNLNAQRKQPIGHIGKRIFEQQFQDGDTEIDFVDTDHPNRSRQRDNSLSIDISQQIAALECTDNSKPLLPKQNFELSSFTDHQSKVFGDDLLNPIGREFTDRIDVNFSVVDPFPQNAQKDDLDEIQKHLEQAQPNFLCPGPYSGRREVSQYIEVDLNMTHVAVQNDVSDMSITDTIHSPKVNVSKTNTSHQTEKKATVKDNWEADKENIVVNPYVAPRESDNFAINDVPDKVLVFDGKRLTIQSEKAEVPTDVSLSKNSHGKKKSSAPQRKTIVLNVNDDLPNFTDDIDVSNTNASSRKEISIAELKKTMIFDEDDISITASVQNKVVVNSEHGKTQLYSKDFGNLSVTQALPSNIIATQKRQTIIYALDTGNISMTQALPANILIEETKSEEVCYVPNATVFDRNDISITQAVPSNIGLVTEEVKQVVDLGDISVTQALPGNIVINKKRHTIMFEDNAADISMTQVLPPNILIPNIVTVNRNDTNELLPKQHFTENVDSKIITEPVLGTSAGKKRNTIFYENDAGNISLTQALPPRILSDAINSEMDSKLKENTPSDGSLINLVESNKVDLLSLQSNSEMSNVDELGNISITQALPSHILKDNTKCGKNDVPNSTVFDNNDISTTEAVHNKIEPLSEEVEQVNDDLGDISVTQALPSNIMLSLKRRTIMFEDDAADISITKALPPNILVPYVDATKCYEQNSNPAKSEVGELFTETISDNRVVSKKRNTIFYENDTGDVSMTQAVPPHILIPYISSTDCNEQNETKLTKDVQVQNVDNVMTEALSENKVVAKKRNTIFYENDTGDVSMTQAVPPHILIPYISSTDCNERNETKITKDVQVQNEDNVITEALSANSVIVKKRNTIFYENDTGDISMTQAVPPHILTPYISSTDSNDRNETKMTKDVRVQNVDSVMPEALSENKVVAKKRNTIFYENDTGDISMTQAVPPHILTPYISSTNCNDHNETKMTKDVRVQNVDSVMPEALSENNVFEKKVENDTEDVSMTQAAPPHLLLDDINNSMNVKVNEDPDSDSVLIAQDVSIQVDNEMREHLKSQMLNVEDVSNISKTRALPSNILTNRQRRSIMYENDTPAESVNQTLPPKILVENKNLASVEKPKDCSLQHNHTSNQVVKMLTFEDEGDEIVDITDNKLKQSFRSPLKKHIAIEDSAVTDKSKVIPSYLKDVSDGIKELMLDLVKPMVDVDQTELDEPSAEVKQNTSTTSQQIQANLVTSSQIDLQWDNDSNPKSHLSHEKKNPSPKVKGNVTFEDCESDVMISRKVKRNVSRHSPLLQTDPSQRVIQFDQNNPLNNILILPKAITEPHKYPMRSVGNLDDEDAKETESSSDSEHRKDRSKTETYTSYRCASVLQPYQASVTTDDELASIATETVCSSHTEFKGSQSTTTSEWTSLTSSKGFSHLTEVRDAKANTVIAMVENEALLAAEPSLGLLDDGIDFELCKATNTNPDDSNNCLSINGNLQNPKKRSLSVTPNKPINADVTLKPILKMPKISNSPLATKCKETSVSSLSDSEDSTTVAQDKAAVVTVARCSMECSFKQAKVEDREGQSVAGAGDEELNNDVIFVEDKPPCVIPGTGPSWEMEEAPSSTNVSCFNVITTIDQLPFMGTEEVEWECWSGDTWWFRVLGGRLRLAVRLAHRIDNSLRTHVVADTPVVSLQLHTPTQAELAALSCLCVGFAGAAMRACVEAGVRRAGEVPRLLRRLAAVARLALRWHRALQAAAPRLALTIAGGSEPIVLKVANIPLRSVWEVRISMELARSEGGCTCWPRARDVTITTLAGDSAVSQRQLADIVASVPDDWGHVPRTIWRIFKYLKNKKAEDDMLMSMRPPLHNKQHIRV